MQLFLTEFFKRKEQIKSMNDLIKKFMDIVADESNLIKNGSVDSVVALKHVATGKYLSSIENLHYTTGARLNWCGVFLILKHLFI